MTDPELARLIVESANDFAIVTMDEAGRITSWNVGAEQLFGWTPAEAIGRPGAMFFTAEDREAGSPAHEMARARTEGRALDERFHERKDGSRLWGSGLMMPMRSTGGFLKIIRDRTSEREAERRVATLTDALPGFVFEADADGHFVQANARFQRYTGRDQAGLLGDRWLEVVEPGHRPRVQEAWGAAIRSGEAFNQTFLVGSGAGEYRCFACRGIPERDGQGRVLRWIGTCIDVEDEAQARAVLEGLNLSLEHAVTERTAELARSHRTLESAVAERERVEEALRQSQKMEAIGQLTGGVAHDFNNLLTVILGSIDLLKRPDLSEEKRGRYLASIGETAERAARLTNQLLAFARRQPLQAQAFDVVARLRESEEVLRTVAGSRVRIAIAVSCEACVVEADPDQFDTAILNMAVNARDAMDGEGTITIRVAERDGIPAVRGHAATPGRFVAVSVGDTGSGIAPGDVARIFEPFFTTKEVGKGTGLGLSQVFGFAKQSGGEIAIESEAGHGATFQLYLPQAAGRLPPQRARPAPPHAAPASPHGGCVLLVEDNQLVGEFAAQLVGDLGYGNLWVSGAQEALTLIEHDPQRFDIVFTDVVMPGTSGIELAEALRARYPHLPVVLTSGYSHVLAAEGSHGFELLQKPYTADGLARVLHRALQG